MSHLSRQSLDNASLVGHPTETERTLFPILTAYRAGRFRPPCSSQAL